MSVNQTHMSVCGQMLYVCVCVRKHIHCRDSDEDTHTVPNVLHERDLYFQESAVLPPAKIHRHVKSWRIEPRFPSRSCTSFIYASRLERIARARDEKTLHACPSFLASHRRLQTEEKERKKASNLHVSVNVYASVCQRSTDWRRHFRARCCTGAHVLRVTQHPSPWGCLLRFFKDSPLFWTREKKHTHTCPSPPSLAGSLENTRCKNYS